MLKYRLLSTLAATALLSTPAMAVEGMFTPEQLPLIADELKEAGLEIDPANLTDLTGFPMGAIISLGGCTASFVSPQGLVITNHHCARGSVQYNSTEENNYLADGFLASELSAELPAAPGSRVYVTVAFSDVTEDVTGDLTDEMTGRERYDAIEAKQKAIVEDCESDPGHRCQVAGFYGGLEYKLIKRLEIRDVRIVHAPADAVGKYGGDIDNWQWPRHTGDYAFYRAYVAPDGSAADYAEENVPYQPEHMLKVSAAGLDDGDFVMAAGYPGSTSRYARLAEVQNTFGWLYPTTVDLWGDWIATIEEAAPEGSDARIKYESRLAGVNNYYKNYIGQIDGARRVGLVDRREAREAALDAWIAADPSRAKYATAIATLDELSEQNAQVMRDTYWYSYATRPQLLQAAEQLYRLSKEREKPNAEREPGYQERDMTFFTQRMQQIDRRYDPVVDKAEWMLFLDGYMDRPADERVEAFDTALGLTEDMTDEELSQVLDGYYADTMLGDVEKRAEWMAATPADFEASDDPFVELAVALYETDMKRENAAKEREGRIAAARPDYMSAIVAWQESEGTSAYPDANGTLRVTYGNVMGGSPKDGLIYTPFTTLEGITAKNTGIDPFDAPQAQLDVIAAGDYGDYELESIGSVPVNFLTDLDSTGGNSGSATLNAQGELVGLLFERNVRERQFRLGLRPQDDTDDPRRYPLHALADGEGRWRVRVDRRDDNRPRLVPWPCEPVAPGSCLAFGRNHFCDPAVCCVSCRGSSKRVSLSLSPDPNQSPK